MTKEERAFVEARITRVVMNEDSGAQMLRALEDENSAATFLFRLGQEFAKLEAEREKLEFAVWRANNRS